MQKQTYLVLFLFFFIGCKKPTQTVLKKESYQGLITKNAMVVSARIEASKIGSTPGIFAIMSSLACRSDGLASVAAKAIHKLAAFIHYYHPKLKNDPELRGADVLDPTFVNDIWNAINKQNETAVKPNITHSQLSDGIAEYRNRKSWGTVDHEEFLPKYIIITR